MRHGITAALAVAAFAIATSAEAVDNESGFYAGAGIGQFDVQIDDVDDLDTTIDRYSTDDTAWKAFGGWRVNPYFAVELAYVNLGSPDDEILPGVDLEVETDGFAPYLVGVLPIGDWFEVFGKAGYYFYDSEATVTSAFGELSEDESNETFTWAVGAGFNLFEVVNIRLEYEQFDFDEADDAEALWLTGAVRF
jgi:OOP family OmpA-OmpF porin